MNEWLALRYGYRYVEGPWFRYICSGDRPRWCQPDGLIVDIQRGRIVICETKLKHTSDAWYQLRQLYHPVISHVFGPTFTYGLCEIVRWYDIAVPFPEYVRMSPNPHKAGMDKVQVTIYNPRG